MAVGSSKILVAVESPTGYIKIVGRAGAERSRDFRTLIQNLQRQGLNCFVLDLNECLLMDSTFAGVLAGLITASSEGQAVRFTLVRPTARVADTLDNLGVLGLVQRLDGEGQMVKTGAAEELKTGEHSHQEIAACCLEAHRILMALKPENVGKFQALERVLIAQLEKTEGQ